MTRPEEQDHEPPEAKAKHVQSQLRLKQPSLVACPPLASVIFNFVLLAEGVLVQNTFRFISVFFGESAFGILKCVRNRVHIFVSLFIVYLVICLFILEIIYQWYRTRRWRKFQNRKPIGEVGCCESEMAERSH